MSNSLSSLKPFLPKKAVVMAKKGAPASAKKRETPAEPIQAPGSKASKRDENFEQIEAELNRAGGCKACKLCQGRNRIVFGVGTPKTRLVFVGEAPGEQEDLQGVPFVGRAGQLLDKMIEAMGLSRDQIYICNVVKCRPPENRNPEPDEIAACSGYLHRQLDVIRPEVIVTLGKFASQTLLQSETPISQLRGNFHEYRGAKLMPTFHPAYLLRNPSSKKECWSDLQQVARELKIQIPRKSST